MKTLRSATLVGVDAVDVEVEATFTKGLPAFSIVGLASSAIQESKDRIKSALQTNGFKFPPLKITVNLSPSDLKKEGSQFDLPIALLIALQNDESLFQEWHVFGELGLGGKLKDCDSIYPIILSLIQQGILHKALVPKESLSKLALIPDVEFIGLESLQDAIGFFRGELTPGSGEKLEIQASSMDIDASRFYYLTEYEEDFADVKGQILAKRAALIAAAGFHNLIFEGSPGCGKSMIAKRLRYILPPMSKEEILNQARIDALDGKEPLFLPVRPFRSPHHSSTKASVFGGGTGVAKIGEIALANKGILFFDELPHFPKAVLEALREPLEDQKVRISRVNAKVEYETDVFFIGAQNPCPCGNLLSPVHECRCSDLEVERYKSRLSEPFLDRIDLFVQMQDVTSQDQSSVTSSELHAQVLKSFATQKKRGQKNLNGRMESEEIKQHCILEEEAHNALEKAISRFGLSQRGINKVKKVARTIADLEGSAKISKKHLLESLNYRRR